MTDDPLEGPKLKIERANAHIDELMITVKAFFDSRPYEIFTERDPNEKEDWVKLRMTRQPPGQIAILVGEALFNLRSALDHLICALAIQHRAAKITDVYFPVGRSKEHFEFPETQRKIQRISDDAKAVVHSLLPYKGGNDLLYALHQTQLIDKHRNLVPIGAIPQGGAFRGLCGLSTQESTFSVCSRIGDFWTRKYGSSDSPTAENLSMSFSSPQI